MNYLYYKQNKSDFILREYGIHANNIETDFSDNSISFIPTDLSKDDYVKLFNTYNNYNILFVLDFTFEAYTDNVICKNFYDAVLISNTHYNRVLLLYNNTYQSGLNSYFYDNQIINTLSFPRWYYEYGAYIDNDALNRFDYGEYDFSCFNFIGRPHKKDTVQYIDSTDINCISTYVHNRDFECRTLQSVDNPPYDGLDKHIYYYGKINICTETMYYNETNGFSNIIHLTEKVYRNLFYKIPFTLISNKHALLYLKTLGFKTFDSLIDESYDYESDDIRYIKSVESAKLLLNFWKSSELDDILSYNRQHFTNKTNTDLHFNKNIITNLETKLKLIKK